MPMPTRARLDAYTPPWSTTIISWRSSVLIVASPPSDPFAVEAGFDWLVMSSLQGGPAM